MSMYWNEYNDDRFFFFWSGPFSQWAIRPMTISNVEYNCCEQYMMSMKAKLFGDEFMYERIMAADDPKEQKRFGRMVTNFDPDLWTAKARDIVTDGNYAKFRQHKELLENLKLTENRIIVEASPYDVVWGIGLHAREPEAKDPSKWKGTNWLGECIMRVRDRLRAESYI